MHDDDIEVTPMAPEHAEILRRLTRLESQQRAEGASPEGGLSVTQLPAEWLRLVALAKARKTTPALLIDAIADGSRPRTLRRPTVDDAASRLLEVAEQMPSPVRLPALLERAGLTDSPRDQKLAGRVLRADGWESVAARVPGLGVVRVWRRIA